MMKLPSDLSDPGKNPLSALVPPEDNWHMMALVYGIPTTIALIVLFHFLKLRRKKSA